MFFCVPVRFAVDDFVAMASEEYLDQGVYSRRRLCQRMTDDKNLNFNIWYQYTTY